MLWRTLTGIYHTLPFILILCTSLAIVASGCNSNADVDQIEDVLIKQPLSAEILHPLAVY